MIRMETTRERTQLSHAKGTKVVADAPQSCLGGNLSVSLIFNDTSSQTAVGNL